MPATHACVQLPTVPLPRHAAPPRSVLMDKGIRGAIPQPDGWKLPPTITDISLGNNNKPPTNQLRGPLPPNWELPPREWA